MAFITVTKRGTESDYFKERSVNIDYIVSYGMADVYLNDSAQDGEYCEIELSTGKSIYVEESVSDIYEMITLAKNTGEDISMYEVNRTRKREEL